MNDSTRSAVPIEIQGTVEPDFEEVKRMFAFNFSRDDVYRDVGAALAVYVDGHCVVNLWAGHSDAAQKTLWKADTLSNLYSATKGVVALAAAQLFEEKGLALTTPVAKIWPEFAAHGKGDIKIWELLAHRARLPGFVETTTLEDLYNWDKCCSSLARQAPAWSTPQTSYHAVTWGYLVGEVMRRINGDESVGHYLQRRLAGPLAADFFVGVPEARLPDCAQLLEPREKSWLLDQDMTLWLASKISAKYRPLTNPRVVPKRANDAAWRKAEIPAANGHASAHGLARIYGALANARNNCMLDDGCRLDLSGPSIDGFCDADPNAEDLFTGNKGIRALGLTVVARDAAGRPAAWGHMGWGGCLGCANFEKRIGLGYVTNQMGVDVDKDDRARILVQAAFRAAGIRFRPS